MQSKKSVFRLAPLTVALMGVYGVPACAQDAEVDQYIKPDSTISVGAQHQSSERPQFGVFDGNRDKGAKLLLDADIKKRDDATGIWNELKLYNLGTDNREVSFSHSRQGDYGVSAEYSRIPRELQHTVNTRLTGFGTINQTVTDVVTPGTGINKQLGTTRDRYTLKLDKVLNNAFEFNVQYREEAKKGTRPFSAYTGAVANFLVEPISSTTRQFEAKLNYLGKNLQFQGGYYGSWFDNANALINVSSGAGGATKNFISLPPDNQAHQLYLNGSYAFSSSTKATMRLASTTATQNDNSVYRALPAAQVWTGFAGGVKAKIVTDEAQFGISSRPTTNLSLLASVNYQDRKDKTPHIAYNSQATPDETTPHSFKSLNGKLEAAYRWTQGFRLLGGLYQENRDRSIPFKTLNSVPAAPTIAAGFWTVPTVTTNEREVPYRTSTRETTYKAQATTNISEMLNASLSLSHSKRDGSRFLWNDQQNLINPLHMANRDRDKVGVRLDWSPSERVSIQAQLDGTRDDYGRNGLNGNVTSNGFTLFGTGIKDGRAHLFSLDATFALSDKWKLGSWYSRDDTQASQYAYQANAGFDPIRKYNLRDIGDSFGFNIAGQVSAKLAVGADLQWNQSVSKYGQTNSNNQANMTETLPTITNKALRLSLNGTYQVDKSGSVRLDLIHDRWDTNDWTWMMWNNTQTALIPLAYGNSDGTTLTAKSKQTSNSLAVRYIYKFQ